MRVCVYVRLLVHSAYEYVVECRWRLWTDNLAAYFVIKDSATFVDVATHFLQIPCKTIIQRRCEVLNDVARASRGSDVLESWNLQSKAVFRRGQCRTERPSWQPNETKFRALLSNHVWWEICEQLDARTIEQVSCLPKVSQIGLESPRLQPAHGLVWLEHARPRKLDKFWLERALLGVLWQWNSSYALSNTKLSYLQHFRNWSSLKIKSKDHMRTNIPLQP